MTFSSQAMKQNIQRVGLKWFEDVMTLAYPPLCALTLDPIDEGEFSPCARADLLKSMGESHCWRCMPRSVRISSPSRRVVLNAELKSFISSESSDSGFTRPIWLLPVGASNMFRVIASPSPWETCFAEMRDSELRELPFDLVVPVPLHWWTQWRRRYNPSEILAQRLALSIRPSPRKECDCPMSENASSTPFEYVRTSDKCEGCVQAGSRRRREGHEFFWSTM